MSFALETGYLPIPIDQMMNVIMTNVNTQFGTTYTEDTFLGTNFYKFFYALVQRLQENEIKTSEIFLRMQEYFVITNESIQRPNTTHPGIYDYFQSKGYFVSTKPPIDADAGKAYICVDVDNTLPTYATVIKPFLCGLVKNCVVAGVVSQGTETTSITLTNGQSFDFKFNLPVKVPIKLKLTLTLSENNEYAVSSPDAVKQVLYNNIVAKYRLGKNFEPQRYFSVADAPWASSVLLQYSVDAGVNWLSAFYNADYNYVLTFSLTDITIVEV
jgi:hypothetical protein